ncbi:PREDICTED: cadherin-related family member 5, partial [Galeopterus variegatus]|uniref:Cadherin-related family member 5 n=1 Tax=Galeopterus variegatus TaxID=482537 RepID=A0ABM0SBW2_GALVR
MGAWALLWPLLLPLLIGLLGQLPEAQAQACTVSENFFEVEENTNLTEPLVNISTPEGYQVTLGSSSTPFAFLILRNQLFLNVIPDYEENSILQAELECKRGETLTRILTSMSHQGLDHQLLLSGTFQVILLLPSCPCPPHPTLCMAEWLDPEPPSPTPQHDTHDAPVRASKGPFFLRRSCHTDITPQKSSSCHQPVTSGALPLPAAAEASAPAARIGIQARSTARKRLMTLSSFSILLCPQDTKVNSTVIPEEELEAEDRDKDDILFYTLQEVTPGVRDFFSLVGANRPALRLDQRLDFYKWPSVTFLLLVRDTREENAEPSHTATATVLLEVLPADLRPPWFLPCSYSDDHVCIEAQYHGAVPTGQQLLQPLILRPGPVYAVDGDRGINQRILYSILTGNVNNTFVIGADSGNLTMKSSVPSPMTFLLVVKGEQADFARYSVTQVTVEARAANGSLPHFPQSLYHGTVVLGSGAGVAVKDADDPSQPLRIQAQDPEFPDLNSAIMYQVTNHSYFWMNGETMLTTTTLTRAEVFYAEVEAKNTVTSGTATTVVEIQVSEKEVPSTGMPAEGLAQDRRFSVVDMAVLGGVLGALLLLAITGLTVLVHKHYCHQLGCCSRKAPL